MPAGLLKVERIEVDDLSRHVVLALLSEHLTSMHTLSPPESVHALDVSRLKAPGITFWTAWSGEVLMACGALKELDARHGEVKSMRTPDDRRGHGAGRAMLAHIVQVARDRGYEHLSLETGSQDAFLPAQALYASVGFKPCGPFGAYREDRHSVFMTLELANPGA
jgi:putative acetyltransferase